MSTNRQLEKSMKFLIKRLWRTESLNQTSVVGSKNLIFKTWSKIFKVVRIVGVGKNAIFINLRGRTCKPILPSRVILEILSQIKVGRSTAWDRRSSKRRRSP
jgi:hypothetical protein